ncbi:MAG: 23S rRNA (pseudouridine(1915)-N(3))-methyltransferase RlmH, partial [Clostridia bacterium]
MNITVICVGKIKEKYFTAAIDEYSKRLSRFVKLNIIEVADEKIPDNASEKEIDQIKEKEGGKILSKLPPNSFIVTLCIEGKEISSEELAKKIADV